MIEVWWSPAAECYRVEDGIMYTYYEIEHVLAHLRERGLGAFLVPPPHNLKTALLDTALRAAGLPVAYIGE